MKYREDFEDWLRQDCHRLGDKTFRIADDGMYSEILTKRFYDVFAAGYEAALEKGRDDGIV